MKTLFLLALLCLSITSCVTVRASIGMSEDVFISKYKSADLIKMSTDGDVYHMVLFINAQATDRYFYFQDRKLIQVDGGQRIPDLTIQVNKSN